MAVAHYLEALKWQKEVIKIHTNFGGLVGGVAASIDMNGDNAIDMERLNTVKDLITQAKAIVEQLYVPDLLAIASFNPEGTAIGGGLGNFISYCDVPQNGIADISRYRIPRGIILNRNVAEVLPLDHADPHQIQERIAHSWYEYLAGVEALHPWDGTTRPKYTGPEPPLYGAQ